MTPTEELLLHIKLASLPDPVLEHQFHEVRRWRLDMAWIDLKLAVEIHGAVYKGGRHTRGKGFTNDREKMNEAALQGWLVLEVTPQHIKNGKALNWIERAIR